MTNIKTVQCAELDPADRVDPRLGRHVEHDERSKRWPARALPGGEIRTRLWNHDAPLLDQGDLGSCTGFAAADLFNCSVMALARQAVHGTRRYLTNAHGLELYKLATGLDEFPGTYPPEDTGSSGLGVAKAARQLGYITEYRHVLGFQHLLTVVPMCPVIVGTWWYEGMSRLDRKGFAHPTGSALGGHEYLLLGQNADDEYFTFLQSWGPWGKRDRGRFYIKFDEFEELLLDDGDATVLVGATPKGLHPEEALHAAPDDKDAL